MAKGAKKMISANEAKKMTNQYYEGKEEENKKAATQKLDSIGHSIECNAQNGLSSFGVNDRVGFFKSQRVEEIVVEELKNLGYKVNTSNGHFVVRWSD